MQCKACGQEQICSPLPTSSLAITQTELLCYTPAPMFRYWFCPWLLLIALSEISVFHFSPPEAPALPHLLANVNRQGRVL